MNLKGYISKIGLTLPLSDETNEVNNIVSTTFQFEKSFTLSEASSILSYKVPKLGPNGSCS